MSAQVGVGIGQAGIGQRVVGVVSESLLEISDGFFSMDLRFPEPLSGLSGHPVQFVKPPEISLMGFGDRLDGAC